MKIRKAKPEESKEISKLIRNTILKINSKHYPKKQMDFELSCYTPSKIRSYFTEKIIFCMVENKKIIGVSILNLKGKEVDSLYVNNKFIGKGFGWKLLTYVERYSMKKGIKRIILHPTDYALNFYKKCGYKIKRKFKGTKNGGYPVIEMEKELK